MEGKLQQFKMIKKLKDIFNIKNKVVVITGAAGLLGKKHAEVVATYGGIPILLDINLKKLNELEKYLNKKFNVKSKGFLVDITNEIEVKKNSQFLLKKYKKIDCLINNASNNPSTFINENNITSNKYREKTRLENFDLSTWLKDLEVGLTGAFICSKYYGNIISKNIKGGVILNISSDLGIIAPDQRLYKKKNLKSNKQPVKPISYSVVKSGLIGLTRYLSTYWVDQGVRCNTLCPGGIDNGLPKDFVQKIKSRIPLGRMAKSNDYQGTLIWMISDASKYMNGSIVTVDGGRTVW